MRIDRLEITNFKKFSNYTIDLHPQFTLLVGDNGTGKTTILDALAIAAGIWLINNISDLNSMMIFLNKLHYDCRYRLTG